MAPNVPTTSARVCFTSTTPMGSFSRSWLSMACWNAGVSLMLSRTHKPTNTKSELARNGIRQPQALNASSPMADRTSRMTIRLRNRPSVAVVWIHDV